MASATRPTAWPSAVEKPSCGSDVSAAGIACLVEAGSPAAVGDTVAGDGTVGTTWAGWVVAAIDGSSPSTLPGLITDVAPPTVGIGPNGGRDGSPTAAAGVVCAAEGVVGLADGAGFDDGLGFFDGLGFDDGRGAAVTVTVPAEPGSTDIAGLVAALATAVRVTEFADLPTGTLTATCSRYAVGVTGVASGPTAHVPVPFPLGHIDAKTGARPEGAVESVTVTSGTGPSSAHTDTVNVAVWPLLMLDSPRSTLMHSREGDAVGLGLAEAEADAPADADAAADDEADDDD